jgi:hypothetical protein
MRGEQSTVSSNEVCHGVFTRAVGGKRIPRSRLRRVKMIEKFGSSSSNVELRSLIWAFNQSFHEMELPGEAQSQN